MGYLSQYIAKIRQFIMRVMIRSAMQITSVLPYGFTFGCMIEMELVINYKYLTYFTFEQVLNAT